MSKITPLNLTSIFKYAEDASGQNLMKTVMDYSLYRNGTTLVTYDMIEDVMQDITGRNSPFQSKNTVADMIKKGFIQLVYNDYERLTTSIPFFRKQEGSKSVMVVNITNFAKMNKDGSIQMAPNTLYALLLSAAFFTTLEESIQSVSRDSYIIYARMFTNIIANLCYMDNMKREKIQFLATNFFFYHITEDKSDSFSYTNPYYNNLRYNSKEVINALDSKLPMFTDDSAYKDLKTFIENLISIFPEMKKLTFKNFIERWSTSYGPSTLFAPEYIPYFFYMLIATVCMAPIVNINKISIEVSDKLTTIYRRIEDRVTKLL